MIAASPKAHFRRHGRHRKVVSMMARLPQAPCPRAGGDGNRRGTGGIGDHRQMPVVLLQRADGQDCQRSPTRGDGRISTARPAAFTLTRCTCWLARRSPMVMLTMPAPAMARCWRCGRPLDIMTIRHGEDFAGSRQVAEGPLAHRHDHRQPPPRQACAGLGAKPDPPGQGGAHPGLRRLAQGRVTGCRIWFRT